MMSDLPSCALYESPDLQAAIGPALRPGGLTLTRRGLSFCELPVDAPVLDVGCGAAVTVQFLRQQLRFRAVGIDRSAVMLSRARNRDPGLALIQGTATGLPLRDECLSALVCECVLSLVEDTRQPWQEFYRVLAPGGYLVLTDVYARIPEHRHLLQSVGVDCCLKGACSREALLGRLQDNGFILRVWEDHSRELQRLAAQLVFAGRPWESLWGRCGACGAAQASRAAVRLAKPGYFLLVALKGGQR